MAGHTPWSDIRMKMTPEQIARSDAKTELLRIGMLINKLRTDRGMTQQDLADKLGVTQQAVSKIEWGEEIQLSTVQKVLAILGGTLYVHLPEGNIPLSSPVNQ